MRPRALLPLLRALRIARQRLVTNHQMVIIA